MTTERTLAVDVVVVGASIAGCTTAMLLARAGARVALLEREKDAGAYKQLCTHFIHPCATPTIQRLGLAADMEAAGAVRNSVEVHNAYGWVPAGVGPEGPTHGYSLRRQKLDPLVRRHAAQTPGVTLLLGASATALSRDDGRVNGVVARVDGGSLRVSARLVVAADGRHSRIAELAQAPVRSTPNHRFFYGAYFEDLPLASGRAALLWLDGRDAAYAFPNDDGVTLLVAAPHKDRLPEFRADLEGAFARYFAPLPRAPEVGGARRLGKWMGALDLTSYYREVDVPGLAFVGDAAMASDPLAGVGCGWAFQSGEWLADAVAPGLATGSLDAGVAVYRALHADRLRARHRVLCQDSLAGPATLAQKMWFRAATRDPVVAQRVQRLLACLEGPEALARPSWLMRALWANVAPRRMGKVPVASTRDTATA